MKDIIFSCLFGRYWNSRLATERQRLIGNFTRNDVVCMSVIISLLVWIPLL